jgi:hypothetical protein
MRLARMGCFDVLGLADGTNSGHNLLLESYSTAKIKHFKYSDSGAFSNTG